MGNVAVRVEGLGKLYRIGGKQERYATFRDTLTDAVAAPFRRARSLLRGEAYGAAGLKEEIWALKDVSFEVQHGEVVGIIGRNGAGKSTLLKILSRITEPTEGCADVYGRVGSLLEVGTGFHPELTGRENIFLNGAILGMPREEINRKFDEIVDFAEIEKFIDTPVKHYSSGMGLRLGFAVAAHLEPEILVVDEVLAVGDAQFQKKCLGKMSDVAGEGRTVLFVSHNMAAVQTLCEKTILLDCGRVVREGMSNKVIPEYLRGNMRREATVEIASETTRKGTGLARYTHASLLDALGECAKSFPMGSEITIELQFESRVEINAPSFGVRLSDTLRQDLVAWRTEEVIGSIPGFSSGGTVRLHVHNLNLMPGTYSIALGLSDGYQAHDIVEEALEIEITPHPVYPTGRIPSRTRSVIYTPCSWEFEYT